MVHFPSVVPREPCPERRRGPSQEDRVPPPHRSPVGRGAGLVGLLPAGRTPMARGLDCCLVSRSGSDRKYFPLGWGGGSRRCGLASQLFGRELKAFFSAP